MSIVDMVLSAQDRAAIGDLAAHVPAPSAAAIDALRYVQSRHGWVSDEALAETASVLRMSAAELDQVATFYNLIFRQAVGKNVIMLCDSATCWALGRDGLQKRIGERLGIAPGEMTEDGKFTLLPIVCLGACDKAPALMMGGVLHGDMDAAKLDALLDGAA
jgi:NADH-quinone oxidoreductase subunit E